MDKKLTASEKWQQTVSWMEAFLKSCYTRRDTLMAAKGYLQALLAHDIITVNQYDDLLLIAKQTANKKKEEES